MSFEIEIPVGMDISEVNKKLKDARGNIIETANLLDDLESRRGPKRKVSVEATGEDKLSPEFKAADTALGKLDASTRKFAGSLIKLTNSEQGSIVQLRNKIAADRQAVAQTRAGSLANIQATQILLGTVRSIQAASSAKRGNIDLLKLEETALRSLNNVSFLNAQAREKNNLAIIQNQQAQLQALGVEKNSITAKKQLISDLRKLADSYDQGSAANIRYLAQVSKLKKELEGGGNIFNRFIDGLNKIATVQAGFTALSSIIQTFNGFIGQFVSQTKRVESFQLALANVGLSTAEVNRAFAQASRTANDLGAPLEQVEKSYKRMVPALRAVGATSAETDRFIESITARTQVLGLSSEESGRLLEAFAQVLSKGKLQSEELNQQISELDGAFRTQLADAIGVSTQELEDLIAAGQITADKFVDAVGRMENGVAALTQRVRAGNATVQQLQNLIANLQTANIRAIAKALEPGIKAFLDAGLAVQEFVAEITKTAFGQLLIDTFNGVIIGVRNFVRAFLEAAKVVITVLDPVFQLIRALNNLLQPLGGVIGALTTLVTALVVAKAATAAYHTVLALKTPFAVFIASNALASKSVKAFQVALNSLSAARFQAAIVKIIGSLASFAVKVLEISGKIQTFASKAIKNFDDIVTGSKRLRDIRIPNVFKNFKFPSLDSIKDGAASMTKLGNNTKSTIRSVDGYKLAVARAKIQTEQAANAAVTAASGAGKFGFAAKGAAVGLGVLAAAAVAAAVAIGIFLSAVNEGDKIQNDLGNSTAELAKKYDALGGSVRKQAGFIARIGRFFQGLGRQIQNFFGLQQQQIRGINAGFKEYENVIAGVSIELDKQGGKIRSTSDARKKSDQQLKSSLTAYKDWRGSAESVIPVLQDLITAEEAQERPNKKTIETAKKKIEQAKKDIEIAQRGIDIAEKEIDARVRQGKAVEDLVDSLESLEKITKKRLDLVDISQTSAEASALKEFDNTVKGRIDLETRLTANAVAFAEQRIEVLEDERKALDKLLRDGEISYEEYSTAVIENEKAIADQKNISANAQRKFADDILTEFERIISKGGELSNIYQQISQSILSAYDGVTGAATNAISALGSLIDSVVEREIAGLETGSEKRKQIVLFQLRTQAQLNQLEFEIAQQKLALATRIAVIEARTVQARLQAEAAIAAARGEDDIAAALREAAAAQDEIVQARQDQYKLELQALKIQKLVTDEALNQKAISEGIDPGKNIGTALVGFKDLNRITDEVVKNTKDVGKNLGDRSIENARKSFSEQAGAVDAAKERVDEMNEAFKAVAGTSDIVRKTVDRIASASKKASTELKSIAAIVNGTQARWMGGPVQAGQTYRVNDAGLGREAFVNNFGRIQMLPASQNINWTAPSSGTIIPARMVKQLKSNSDINNKINVATSQTSPVVSIKASRAMGSDSGNLVKRMSSAMAGASTTNRVTNNITIQSQQPVTDASKLMTEAAMMRLRRSRRL